MFIITETGHSINSDFIKNISWAETNLGDGTPYLVKATGSKDEVYYLIRERTLCGALTYIREIENCINEERLNVNINRR